MRGREGDDGNQSPVTGRSLKRIRVLDVDSQKYQVPAKPAGNGAPGSERMVTWHGQLSTSLACFVEDANHVSERDCVVRFYLHDLVAAAH